MRLRIAPVLVAGLAALADPALRAADPPKASASPKPTGPPVSGPLVVGPGALQALDLERSMPSEAEFLKLPDAQVLTFRGKTITVGELKQRHRDALASGAATPVPTPVLPSLDGPSARLRDQSAALAKSDAARALAEFDRLRTQGAK